MKQAELNPDQPALPEILKDIDYFEERDRLIDIISNVQAKILGTTTSPNDSARDGTSTVILRLPSRQHVDGLYDCRMKLMWIRQNPFKFMRGVEEYEFSKLELLLWDFHDLLSLSCYHPSWEKEAEFFFCRHEFGEIVADLFLKIRKKLNAPIE